jgi:hypothetical protein
VGPALEISRVPGLLESQAVTAAGRRQGPPRPVGPGVMRPTKPAPSAWLSWFAEWEKAAMRRGWGMMSIRKVNIDSHADSNGTAVSSNRARETCRSSHPGTIESYRGLG